MAQETSTGWVCTDCMMLICNGETPPDMTEEETAEYLAGMDDEEITPGLMTEEHECGDPENCDHACDVQEFSWKVCDSCHRPNNAGRRHAVTFWFDSEEK